MNTTINIASSLVNTSNSNDNYNDNDNGNGEGNDNSSDGNDDGENKSDSESFLIGTSIIKMILLNCVVIVLECYFLV